MKRIFIVIIMVLAMTSNIYAYDYIDQVYYIEGTLDSQAQQPQIVYAANFIKQVNPECGTYYLYEFVMEYMEYDSTKFSNRENYTYNATTALNERKGTCVDYSLLYCALSRALGYECNIVVTEKGNHCINEVYDGEKWIQVDTTNGYYKVTDLFEQYVTYKIK